MSRTFAVTTNLQNTTRLQLDVPPIQSDQEARAVRATLALLELGPDYLLDASNVAPRVINDSLETASRLGQSARDIVLNPDDVRQQLAHYVTYLKGSLADALAAWELFAPTEVEA